MTWNDRARQLTLEPGAPKGATNLATKRTFRVLLLPAGNDEGRRLRREEGHAPLLTGCAA